MKADSLRVHVTIKAEQKAAAVINTILDECWGSRNKILAMALTWAGWTQKDGWWRP